MYVCVTFIQTRCTHTHVFFSSRFNKLYYLIGIGRSEDIQQWALGDQDQSIHRRYFRLLWRKAFLFYSWFSSVIQVCVVVKEILISFFIPSCRLQSSSHPCNGTCSYICVYYCKQYIYMLVFCVVHVHWRTR